MAAGKECPEGARDPVQGVRKDLFEDERWREGSI